MREKIKLTKGKVYLEYTLEDFGELKTEAMDNLERMYDDARDDDDVSGKELADMEKDIEKIKKAKLVNEIWSRTKSSEIIFLEDLIEGFIKKHKVQK